MPTLTDNSPMPFGKYKGTSMANVPASYLIWLYENQTHAATGSMIDVRAYIEDNMDALKKEK